MTKTKKYILIFAIVVLAFFLRFYNIEQTPPGVYPDEAVNGIDAMTAITTGDFRWFYPANQGREGFFMNWIALFFMLFGVSITTLKLPAIICGTITVIGTYLLTRELFNKERLALISSFLVAVSFWAINFSRISFRANMLPAILVFSFYFLWKGINKKEQHPSLSEYPISIPGRSLLKGTPTSTAESSSRDSAGKKQSRSPLFSLSFKKRDSDQEYMSYLYFAIGGFIFGIGMHSYIAWRIAPAILIVTLISFILSRPEFLKTYWRAILIFLVSSLIAAAPMFYTFYTHPQYLESRSDNVSVLSPKVNQGRPVETFTKSLGLSLVKYNFWGDQNWRHNYPPYPILDPISGIAFLFGIFYSLLKLLRFLYLRFQKKIQAPKMDVHVFLLSWFFLMLAPEFMTAEGLPHALRAIGTLPVTFIFAGLTFEFFLSRGEQHTYLYKEIVNILLIFILVSVGIFNTVKYHIFWAKKIETARSFESVLIDVSDYIKTVPEQKEIYVITGSMQRIPIRLFNWERKNVFYLYPGEFEQVKPRNADNFIVILTKKNDEIISKLQSIYSNLQLEEKRDELGISYYILK